MKFSNLGTFALMPGHTMWIEFWFEDPFAFPPDLGDRGALWTMAHPSETGYPAELVVKDHSKVIDYREGVSAGEYVYFSSPYMKYRLTVANTASGPIKTPTGGSLSIFSLQGGSTNV